MKKKIYGTITDTARLLSQKQKEKVLIPSIYVGDGSVEINGKEVKFELLTTWKQAPMVRVGNKYFYLSWKDILQMAEDRGLFEEVE